MAPHLVQYSQIVPINMQDLLLNNYACAYLIFFEKECFDCTFIVCINTLEIIFQSKFLHILCFS
jgi:hypothetical protein